MAFTIPEDELTFRATRSRGPGGQHVNKTSTRIEVVWDVGESPVLSDAQRERIIGKLANRIDAGGRLRVAADTYRSQQRNREAAIDRLQILVREALHRPKPRKKTKPTKASREERLQQKRERGEKKVRRRPPQPDE